MSETERRQVVPDYFMPAADETKLVTLLTTTPMEADLAQVKLESEGVQCFAADSEMARINPLLGVIPVRLQVRQDDLERAREILARPPEDVQEGDYVEEEWRCPQCRKKVFDLLPLTPGRRRLRDTWVVLMLLPFVWYLVPLDQLVTISPAAKTSGVWLWLAAVLTIGPVVIVGKRGKRCRGCGWTKPA
jgi:hypothetical protein